MDHEKRQQQDEKEERGITIKPAMTCPSDCMEGTHSCERPKETESLLGKQFHRFMDLPLSIRYMIYELLLVRGKIFVKNSVARRIYSMSTHTSRPPLTPLEKPAAMQTSNCEYNILPYTRDTYTGCVRQRYSDLETYPKPDSSLLQGVSKAVQEEAERIFWSTKNLFVFPAGEFLFPTYYHSTNRLSSPHPPKEKQLAKAISYAFDMRDGGPLDPYATREHDRHANDGPTPFDDLTPAQKMQRLHDVLDKQLESVWDDRCFLLTRHLRLDRLELDFADCYCALGCCRKVAYVCAQLVRHAAFAALCYRRAFRYGVPPVFEVLGCRDEGERLMVREWLADGCRVGRDSFVFVDKVVVETEEEEEEEGMDGTGE